jgi:hypothetical protein
MIDILKIDVEGDEHEALNVNTFDELKSLGVSIRQIVIEIHHNLKIPDLFQRFKERSLYIFHKEPNTMADTNCIEYGFLNISFACPVDPLPSF